MAAGTLAAMAVSARGRAEDKHQQCVNDLRILTKRYCHSRIPRIKYLRLRGERLLLKENKKSRSVFTNDSSEETRKEEQTVWGNDSACNVATETAEVCRCHGNCACVVQESAIAPAVDEDKTIY